MENLLALVDKIQRVSPLPVFTNETIIVQNPGMQHWLNLSLANMRGISMNCDYALPSQFLWKLLRTLASKDKVPEQSPYSREVLCWRIYSLLQSKEVTNNSSFSMATQYWLGRSGQKNQSEAGAKYSSQALLKCYQLAVQLADLFEQYLIFRPNWINQWNSSVFTSDNESIEANEQYDWQGKLWAILTQEHPYDPMALIDSAVENISNIDTLKTLLPPRIFFFGINAMPPIWLDFIHKLSKHVDIHFFHLNPCYAYWGDLLTEKQAYRTLNAWCEGVDDISHEVGNPLLANLGQQGREFMAMLQRYSTINIDVFEDFNGHSDDSLNDDSGTRADIDSDENDSEQANALANTTVLQAIQSDILHLRDQRSEPSQKIDQSIVVSSAHSALREVQALHDWLLHQFNHDPNLAPKDVLVMCPHVEDYAPYVNAVFSYGWQKVPDSTPPLPCSIADRISKDSEPLVAAFSSLIALPDSRFKVSELIGYLRLPALQQKFDLTSTQIDTLCLWIDSASIHWGLNADHKAELLSHGNSSADNDNHAHGFSEQFTWEYGLNKLLKGFAYSEEAGIYADHYVLPNVEGANSVLLGQLMLILEQLQYFGQNLNKPRTAAQWQVYLLDLVEQFFGQSEDTGFDIISHAIASLASNCSEAAFDNTIEWVIVSEYLNHHFSQPDPGRQFMVGQVTFCSMLPMRSIPFKVIAILGLNDGDFPRQRQELGFDLLALTPPQLGDRSRRGDDRYLFLEAIISARQSLYLSYQGRNIKNNTVKQPSIVLQELLQYLTLGYGWNFEAQSPDESVSENDHNQASQLRQLPMQPFSSQNYQGKWPSFDAKWLALVSSERSHRVVNLEIPVNTESSVSNLSERIATELDLNDINSREINLGIHELVRFYQHPSKYFAQQQLSLYLDTANTVLDDTEPFTCNALETYTLRQDLLAQHIEHKVAPESTLELNDSLAEILQAAKLRGKFPDLPSTDELLNNWAQDSENFSEYISERSNADIIPISVEIPVSSQGITFNISVSFPVADDKLVFYRSSGAKWKDYFTLYCTQLLLVLWQQNYYASEDRKDIAKEATDEEAALLKVSSTVGYYFETKTQKMMQCSYVFGASSAEHDEQQGKASSTTQQLQVLLDYYMQGLTQPLLLNGELSEKAFKAKQFEQADFEFYWQDSNSFAPLGADNYVAYFWKECPEFSLISDDLETIYQQCFSLREVVKS